MQNTRLRLLPFLLPVLVILMTSAVEEYVEAGCAEARLKDKASFPVGTAINTEKLKFEKPYWTSATGQFNSFTPEKILKPQYIHPQKDAYAFEEVDQLMAFCRERNIRLHGHALLWHKALPMWMEKFKGSPEEWEEMMKAHIQQIVRHCSGYIKSWDVVNEAFNDDGTLRNNIWLKHIGETYIEKAFRYAHEADPSAVLFYNDYSLERNDRKLESVLGLLKALKDNGVPVHGIGLQMHVSLEFPPSGDILGATTRVHQAGFVVHFSELDVTLTGDHMMFVPMRKRIEAQRGRYREIVSGFMTLPASSRFGITLWGVSDNDTWLNEENPRSRPLLLDDRYNIKPAYCGFIEGIGKPAY
jgi:endo-1,4-beta-xylanase